MFSYKKMNYLNKSKRKGKKRKRKSRKMKRKIRTKKKKISNQKGGGKVNVFIKMPSGQTMQFIIDSKDNVNILKQQIKNKVNIPEDKQRLIYAGKEIDSSTNISSYEEDELYMTLRSTETPVPVSNPELEVAQPLPPIHRSKLKKDTDKSCDNILEEEQPIYLLDEKQIVFNVNGDPCNPRPKDKLNHVRPLIDKFEELISSGIGYNLYISIGSNCSNYAEEFENCVNGQVKLPTGWCQPDIQTLVLVIDHDASKMKTRILAQDILNLENYEFLDMLWLDDVPELSEVLTNFIDYNKEKEGKCLCINYVKYDKFNRSQNPVFTNLVKSFYGEYPLAYKAKDHLVKIRENRALYLDFIPRQGGRSSGKTLVEFFYHPNAHVIITSERTELESVEGISKAVEGRRGHMNRFYFSTQKISF